MIKIKSHYLNEEIEVNGYNVMANDQEVVLMNHSDFEALYLAYEEKMQLRREYQDLTDLYKYPAIRCIITSGILENHHSGNKIGSAHPKSLKNNVSQSFPAEMAEKRAFDRAVKEFFALESRVYSEDEILGVKVEKREDHPGEDAVLIESSAETIAKEMIETAAKPTDQEPEIVPEVAADTQEGIVPAEPVMDVPEIDDPIIPDQEEEDYANMHITFGQYFLNGQDLTVKETFEYDKQQVASGAQKKSLIDFFLTKARPDPERNPERAKQLEAIKKYAASIGYIPATI